MDDYISNFQYKVNNENHVQSVIYPLNSVVNQNNVMKSILGGSTHIDSGYSRFEGLGVPIGLYLSKNKRATLETMSLSKNANKDINIECSVIDEELYEKLINKIARKRSSQSKTLKSRNPEKSRKTKRK